MRATSLNQVLDTWPLTFDENASVHTGEPVKYEEEAKLCSLSFTLLKHNSMLYTCVCL